MVLYRCREIVNTGSEITVNIHKGEKDMKETKAQRIYKDTMMMIRKHVRDDIKFGHELREYAVQFEYKDDERLCSRTINNIEQMLIKEVKVYNLSVSKGWIDRNDVKEQAFKIMAISIKKWRADEEKWRKMLNSIEIN